MPVIAVLGITAAVLLYLGSVAAGHMLAGHLETVAIAAGITVAAVIVLLITVIRWAGRRTLVTRTAPALEAPKQRRELPAPARADDTRSLTPAETPQPFGSDPGTWAQIIDEADRDELKRPGPRESREQPALCEGPGCRAELDDMAWTIKVEVPGDEPAEHSFCSRQCLDCWQQEDIGKRAGRTGGLR